MAAALGNLSPAAYSQETVAQQLAIIDEKLDKLRADVEALQFNQQKAQKQIDDLREQMNQLRRAGLGVSPNDLQALEAKIKAVDNSRIKDNQTLVDQLAKELEAMSRGRTAGKPTITPTTNISTIDPSKEHVVQKGETLTIIAKASRVSLEDLKKANNITNANEIKVGQKLKIP